MVAFHESEAQRLYLSSSGLSFLTLFTSGDAFSTKRQSLRVYPTTIYRLLKRKEIPGFKVGSDYRFNRESIDRWRLRQRSAADQKI